MKPLTPEQATIILHAVGIPALKAEHPVTQRVIAAIPDDKVDYRPDDIVKSAIDLAWHIVIAENRFLDGVARGEFDLTPKPRPDSIRTAADVNRWYVAEWANNLERLRTLSGDQLIKPVDFRGVFRFPAVVYVQIALQHSIHHRGQDSRVGHGQERRRVEQDDVEMLLRLCHHLPHGCRPEVRRG